MMSDDPFDIFDDSEDNDSEEGHDESHSSVAERLLEDANRKMLEKSSNESIDVRCDSTNQHVNSIDLSKVTRYKLHWDAPLFLGPLICVSSLECGGGRGFVAARDLEPGTLIMVEEPIIDWPEEQIGKELGSVSIYHILNQPNAQKIIHDLEDFHPTKLAVDKFDVGNQQVRGMVEMLERKLEDEFQPILSVAENFQNRDLSPVTLRDLIRILLALRYNGFQSGVYLHLAMINHSCYPNSVKFVPSRNYSEVRTTQHVKAGEPLTISYLPRISSFHTRQCDLWEQHMFEIEVPQRFRALELVCGELPTSKVHKKDETIVTSRIESATQTLEQQYQDVATAIILEKSSENPIWEEIKALEMAILELYTESKDQLQNDCHLLLIPSLRLHLDVCDLIQMSNILNASQSVLLLLRMVQSATHLLKLQTLLYGNDHFNLATTYNELSQALAELLSRAPKQLVKAKMDGMMTISSCSKAEKHARSEFKRIRDLYPKDAEKYINNKDQL